MRLLAKASKSIPIGTAYPVWTGIGAEGTVLKILSLQRRKFLHKCVYLYSKRILETEEEKDWLEKQDFHNSAEDAYAG